MGVGAERLGLKDEVSREQFHALCKNQNPNDGERLTQRSQKEGQRRVFYDFTCSAPESVLVLAVTLDDQRLIEAKWLGFSINFYGDAFGRAHLDGKLQFVFGTQD